MSSLPQPMPSQSGSTLQVNSAVLHSSLTNNGSGAGLSDFGHLGFDFDQLAGDPLSMMGMGRADIDHDLLDFRRKLTYYLMGIGGSVVCCLGTIANALSVAVLTRRVMKSSTYVYLAALAVCDSLVLFFTLLLILKDTKPPDSANQLDQFHAVLFPFVHPTAFVFQVTSIWLTLAFTVDRYVMICHPFSAERMCRRSRARKVVLGIYAGGFLFNIPKYLEYYTTTQELTLTNSSQVFKVHGVETTTIGKDEVFREVVHSWLYLIFVCGIPFLTLVVLNAFLIRAVHLSRVKGKEINVREKHRNDTTIMLIGVIIIFFICQGPALVSRWIYAFQPGTTQNRAVYTLNEVGSFLVILNSAINIVPYYLFGRKFRSEFWRIFCTCFFDKDELRRIVRTYSYSIDHRRMSQYNVMEMNGLGNTKNTSAGVYNPAVGGHSSHKSSSGSRTRTHSPRMGDRTEETALCVKPPPSPASASAAAAKCEAIERVAVPLIHNSSSSSSTPAAGPSLLLSSSMPPPVPPASGRDLGSSSSSSGGGGGRVNVNSSPRSLPAFSSLLSSSPITTKTGDGAGRPDRGGPNPNNGHVQYMSVSSTPNISSTDTHQQVTLDGTSSVWCGF